MACSLCVGERDVWDGKTYGIRKRVGLSGVEHLLEKPIPEKPTKITVHI
jgi:hypothetical protein